MTSRTAFVPPPGPAVEGGRSIATLSAAMERVEERLREALAILQAINHGELLSGLPPDPLGRERHQAAVSLLGVQESLLIGALAEIRS